MNKLVGPLNWLIWRLIEPALEDRLGRYARGRLLDIGSGTKPYADLARPHVSEHVGLDHEKTLHDKREIDLVGTAYDIPAEDASYDTILCTDVLEHLEEPARALAEAHRVLRPGGFAIYTVPLFWHLHEEPRDFYRYTNHGLRYLFESAGFEVVEIQPLCGFVATFSQELVYWVWRFAPGNRLHPLRWLLLGFVFAIQRTAFWLNRFDTSEKFTAEYLAVVRKPEAMASAAYGTP
jgi:SAM-dependent methyltransferase